MGMRVCMYAEREWERGLHLTIYLGVNQATESIMWILRVMRYDDEDAGGASWNQTTPSMHHHGLMITNSEYGAAGVSAAREAFKLSFICGGKYRCVLEDMGGSPFKYLSKRGRGDWMR